MIGKRKDKPKGFGDKQVELVELTMEDGSIFPLFHFGLIFTWFLSRNNILTNLLYNIIEQFDLYFLVCPDGDVLDYLRQAIVRIIQKHDAGTVVRRLGSDEQKWQARVMDAVLQDILRPIYWKSINPNGLALEYESTYQGIHHTRGSRLIADLILQPWETFDLGKYGTLRVVIKPNLNIYKKVKEKFPIVETFEKANPPFSLGSLDGAITSLTRIENMPFDAKPYKFRTTCPRLPAIGDMFFYIEVVTWVYTLVNDRVNAISMSLNHFLHTEIVNSDGGPIGRPVSVKTITINPDGSRTESTEVSNTGSNLKDNPWSREIDSSIIERLYIWDRNYTLTQVLKPMTYLVYGNNDLTPTFNLGWNGEPGAESSPGGGLGPTGSKGLNPQGSPGPQSGQPEGEVPVQQGQIVKVQAIREPGPSRSANPIVSVANSMLNAAGQARQRVDEVVGQMVNEISAGKLDPVEAQRQLSIIQAERLVEKEYIDTALDNVTNILESRYGILGKVGGEVAKRGAKALGGKFWGKGKSKLGLA